MNATPAHLPLSAGRRTRAAASRKRILLFALVGASLFAFAAPRLCAQHIDDHDPIGVTGGFSGAIQTAGEYGALDHSAHRAIDDIVVPGSLGKYPLKMTRYYNSRAQYYALTAIGLSPGWAHEYAWLLWSAGTKVVSPHGNVYDPSCGQPVGVSEGWEGSGTWRLADGGRVTFDGNNRVTDIYDPYGQRTRIAYRWGYRPAC